MRKYAFFDIDHTIYDGYTTSGFYLFLADKKLVPEFVYVKNKEIDNLSCSGKIDYEEEVRLVLKLTARLLKGKKKKEVTKWQKDFMKERNRLFPWVKALFSILKKNNYEIFLISAASSPSAQAVADFLGIKNVFPSRFEIRNGVYTGKIKKILNYKEKIKLIRGLIEDLEVSKKIGFGDSSGDIDMLSQMDIAFLYNPRDKDLIRIAKEKGWHITNESSIIKTVKSNI